jgi:hypothetical protein
MNSSISSKSTISVKTQVRFIRKTLCGDFKIDNIPNIGPKTIEKLRAIGITTSFQLMAKFLSLKGEGVSPREHCDLFLAWLAEVGINGNRNNIVVAVSEKCSVLFTGLSFVGQQASEAEEKTEDDN